MTTALTRRHSTGSSCAKCVADLGRGQRKLRQTNRKDYTDRAQTAARHYELYSEGNSYGLALILQPETPLCTLGVQVLWKDHRSTLVLCRISRSSVHPRTYMYGVGGILLSVGYPAKKVYVRSSVALAQ